MPLFEQGFHLCQQLRPNFSRFARPFGAGLEVTFKLRPANLTAALRQPLIAAVPIRRHNAFGLGINRGLCAVGIAPSQQVKSRGVRRGIDPSPFG